MNMRTSAGWSSDFNILIFFPFPAEIRCLCRSWFCRLFTSLTILCLPWYSWFRKGLFFSYSYEETNHFLHLIFSHSGKFIFPAVFFGFSMPLCFHFPAAGTSGSRSQGSPTYQAHIQLFCCSGHINIGFLVFCCLQGSGWRMKGGWNSGEEGNSACLCPWVMTEVRRRNSCVLRTAAQAPRHGCFALPILQQLLPLLRL